MNVVAYLSFVSVILGWAMSLNPLAAQDYEYPSTTSVTYASDLKAANDAKKLVVKGFFLGMSKDEAAFLVDSKYLKTFSQRGSLADLRYYFFDEGAFTVQIGGGSPGTEFRFDANQKLVSFHLHTSTVNQLFNVSDMPPQEFVQSFVDNYPNVSALDVATADNGDTYWKFSSPDGYEVMIMGDKSITIRLIPKPAERKFD